MTMLQKEPFAYCMTMSRMILEVLFSSAADRQVTMPLSISTGLPKKARIPGVSPSPILAHCRIQSSKHGQKVVMIRTPYRNYLRNSWNLPEKQVKENSMNHNSTTTTSLPNRKIYNLQK